MTDRKNIKVDQETFERLREAKGKYETWDGLFHRLLEDDGIECHECGSGNLTMKDIGAGQEALVCMDCGATLQVG